MKATEIREMTNEELAKKLEPVVIKLKLQAGPDGRLFGSVTSKDIADELEKSTGIKLDKKKIMLDDPIKSYGTYTIDVKLYSEVTGKINVVVSDVK